MTASMASGPAADVVAPEQVALKVTAQRGRVITAHLDEDMTGGAFPAFCSSVFSILSTKPSTYCIKSDLSSNTAWMLQGRRVLFDGGVGSGVVLWQRIPLIFILRDDEGADSVSYTSAVVQPESATLTICPNVLGQVLDALGRPIDSTVSSRASSSAAASLSDGASQERSVFGDATLLADMATISRPMHTGVTAVDALTPIGKGNMFVVYVSTSGRESALRQSALRQGAVRRKCRMPLGTLHDNTNLLCVCRVLVSLCIVFEFALLYNSELLKTGTQTHTHAGQNMLIVGSETLGRRKVFSVCVCFFLALLTS